MISQTCSKVDYDIDKKDGVGETVEDDPSVINKGYDTNDHALKPASIQPIEQQLFTVPL